MATIIRSDIAREMASGPMVQPVSFSFADMRDQAGDYLDTVREEAAKIVQEAHREAERIRRQAETAGRKAAESAIERLLDEKVTKRMETLLPALEQLVAQINDSKGELLGQWERSALKVSTAIAQRIIGRELERAPQIKLDLIAEALRLATGSSQMSLHVNVADYQQLRSQIERLAKTMCRLAPTDIVADPEISAGGCRVESRCGAVDHQIETQIRRIEEELE
jgi:flagellar assembly protein FliH